MDLQSSRQRFHGHLPFTVGPPNTGPIKYIGKEMPLKPFEEANILEPCMMHKALELQIPLQLTEIVLRICKTGGQYLPNQLIDGLAVVASFHVSGQW